MSIRTVQVYRMTNQNSSLESEYENQEMSVMTKTRNKMATNVTNDWSTQFLFRNLQAEDGDSLNP